MKAQVLTGSKQEIADTVARIEGDVREVIVFVQEPSDLAAQNDDIFAKMELFTVKQDDADYSRASLYDRLEGE